MMNLRKENILIVIILAVLVLGGVKMFVYDNPQVLYVLAEGLDEPSSLYYRVIEKIYRLSRNKSEIERILNQLESGENEYLHAQYIRTLGIVGENSAIANYILIRIYTRHQENEQKASIVSSVIDSMGLIGNKSTVSILERLAKNYDNHRMVVPKYPIVRALFLATGDIQAVREKSSFDFIVTDELAIGREVIARSKGRYRTFDEMLALDNLSRPDKFKYSPNNLNLLTTPVPRG